MPPPRTADEALRVAGGAQLVEHADTLLAAAEDGVGAQLVAAYVVGSIATGDARPTTSDLDLMLVVSSPPAQDVLHAAGERIADAAEAGPLAGAEVVVYTRDVLLAPAEGLRYELNVNAGRALQRLVETGGSPSFWFVLDVSAAREHALALRGPPVEQVVGVVPDAMVLAALGQSLRWHLAAEGTSPDAVLNACRAWYWAQRRSWLSKTAAGRWAAAQDGAPPVIAAALAAREADREVALEGAEVRAFLMSVLGRVPS